MYSALCWWESKKADLQYAEWVFFEVTGTKILGLLLHAIHSHLHHRILLPPPMVFLDLRFLQQQLKVGGVLALLTLSLGYL
jgi:hypothetical protein